MTTTQYKVKIFLNMLKLQVYDYVLGTVVSVLTVEGTGKIQCLLIDMHHLYAITATQITKWDTNNFSQKPIAYPLKVSTIIHRNISNTWLNCFLGRQRLQDESYYKY